MNIYNIFYSKPQTGQSDLRMVQKEGSPKTSSEEEELLRVMGLPRNGALLKDTSAVPRR